MRVLFTTAWYPNRKVAGDGVFVQKHARAISRLNDVAVLMVQTDLQVRGLRIELDDKTTSPDNPPHEVLVYVPKTRFEIPVITGLVRMFWLMAGYIKGYRYIKRTYWQGQRPEVCHVNVLTRAAGLPWLLYKLHHIPYIITEHWSRYARPEAYPNSSLQLRLGRLFVRDAAYVCPVSPNLEQAMKKWQLTNRHYTRIGNVVDTDIFTPHSSFLSPHSSSLISHPTFLHVSWLRDDSKNISGMLRVLAALAQRRQDWQMDFVGEGNDKEMLMEQARKLGLLGDAEGRGARVRFLPACSGASLAETMRQHDALVMFSHFENQPVSVLEALACGLPVIATAVATIPGMLAQNRGITVPPRDEAQLLEVLDGFLTLRASMTPRQRTDTTLAAARHEYVASHHSPEVIARQFDALYHASQTQR